MTKKLTFTIFAFLALFPALTWGMQFKAVKKPDCSSQLKCINFKTLGALEGGAQSISFSPDGNSVAAGYQDGTLCLWGIHRDAILWFTKAHEHVVYSLNFSPDGKTLVTTSFDIARLWDAQDRKFLADLKGHKYLISSANYSPDGQLIVTAAADHTAKVWNAENGDLKFTLNHSDDLFSAIFSRDGKLIITGSTEGLRTWDIQNGQLQRETKLSKTAKMLSLSPCGEKMCVVSAFSHLIHIVQSRNHAAILKIMEADHCVPSAYYSPNGKWMLTASGNQSAEVWDPETGMAKLILQGHEDSVRDARFSSNGKWVVTVSYDRTVKLWRVPLDLIKPDSLLERSFASLIHQNLPEYLSQKNPNASLEGFFLTITSASNQKIGKDLLNDIAMRLELFDYLEVLIKGHRAPQ